MKFCNECLNVCILKEDTIKKELFYICNDCDIKIKCDTYLIYDKIYNDKKEIVENINKKYLKNDPTYPIINIDCPKCNHIENIFYKDENMNIHYVCRNDNCNHNWK